MGYSIDLEKAAIRHFEAAESLVGTSRRDVAGYLYGIAAECAIKQLMRRSGILPSPKRGRDQMCPFYAHFPELKTLLLNHCHGRNATVLITFANDVSFMQYWDIKMRYAPPNEITQRNVDHWREQTKKVISKMRGN